jgi:Protein of unknown function (DUF2877)
LIATAASPPARAVVAGPGARRALREGATGAVAHVFGAGGYVSLGEQFLLLAPVRSPLGPLSLLIAGLAPGDLVYGAPASVEDGVLVIASVRVAVDGARVPAPPGRATLSPGWQGALEAALTVVDAAPAELRPGLRALATGDLDGGVDRLAGRGAGLTPAGDDVLAGYAVWRWSQRAPVALPAGRCAPLGRAYLRCAERGELPEPAARVLGAIRAGDGAAARRRAAGLRAWGATSGAALLWGMAAAAGRAAPPAAPAANGRGREPQGERLRMGA